MERNVEKIMKKARKTFRLGTGGSLKTADKKTAARLSDDFYVLEHCAARAVDECKMLKKDKLGSKVFSGLFERCVALCSNGVLPSEEKTVAFFGKNSLGGIETSLLPLAITCALTQTAAKSVESKEKNGFKEFENAVASLHGMCEFDFESAEEKLCVSEPALKADPAGIYSSMDSESKSFYRKRIAAAAMKARKSEKEFSNLILKKSKKSGNHIGKYIVSKEKSKTSGFVFLALEVVVPLSLATALGFFFQSLLIGVLLFFSLWELLRYPIEHLSLKRNAPQRLLRLKTNDERVMGAATLITVSIVLSSSDKIPNLEKHLEQIFLSNCTGKIKVCCLADFKAAAMPEKPEDRLLIKALSETVDRLNRKYGGGFIAAVRPRAYCQTQGEFIGRERKRGAITELIRAIKGKSNGFRLLCGDVGELEKVKYLICLDADSKLVFDTARELVAVAEHPNNHPVIENGRVVSGYGIIAPKIQNDLGEKNTTLFAAVMSDDPGITAYDSLSSERYQDLFEEGIFSGKGLIVVDAFYELLDKGLPKEKILSHDILESGFLRTAFLPDVQITESFPKNAVSFYQRLNRWIRGDWQNIEFIFKKNSLNFISKYKMFDNLRRSLTPVACVLLLCVSALVGGYEGIFAAAVSLAALACRNAYAGICSLAGGGFSMLSRLYRSKTLPAALSAFVRAFVSVSFSAREAFVGFCACITALWRLFVSKKKLLEWTTFAQSEENKEKELFSCLPAIVVSAFLFVFGMPIHRLAGLIILADIPLLFIGNIKIKKGKNEISFAQREKLLSYCGAMWGFFEELCGRENNFLPPDNISFFPTGAVARRTSPTNIGLMLVSFLAARDLGFITSSELYMRLKLSLESVNKLKKYKGNLYNWYSTETLEILEPHFVSTVDSGNFLCCLIALKEGVKEYAVQCEALNSIVSEAERIINETDLTPLFNYKRKLFSVGLDVHSGKKSGSCYDMYMSEARMTAYFAVAKKIVPKSHWGALSRVIVVQGRYTGLASWTGTMFEYFMPDLFLPAPNGSLSDESLRFCLYCQRKRAGKLPFGISESAFYAFDGNLNYQYKAHGVQKLGLKRGMDKETVISPYSTFLTLSTAPKVSVANLEKLEKMGMVGRYGFYEAADFTKGRNGDDFSIVGSFMAHHVGMSFLAADNLLSGRCMQKRFMRDNDMRAAQSLLEEKLDNGSAVFNDVKTQGMRQIRERTQEKNIVSNHPSPFSPKIALLSNGRLTSCISDTGAGTTQFDGTDVTVYGDDLLFAPKGIFAVFVSEKEKIPFVSAADNFSDTKFGAEFFKNRVEHTAVRNGFRLKMTTSVLKNKNCEKRKFTLENSERKKSVKGKLIVFFEPCLEKRKTYRANPPFSKLFIVDEWKNESRCLVFSKNGEKSNFQCAVAAGFAENVEVQHESNREKVLTTPHGIFSLGEKTDFDGKRGNPDCCCAFSVEVEVKPKEKKELEFFIAVEETKELALNTFLAVKAGKDSERLAANPLFANKFENYAANAALPSMIFPMASKQKNEVGKACNFCESDVWSFGISGDNPIMLAQANDPNKLEFIRPYLRLNKILRSCGTVTDLVVSFKAEDGYSAPFTEGLKKMMREEECLMMFGVNGGVHAANLSLHNYSECCALENTALFVANPSLNLPESENSRFKMPKIVRGLQKNSLSIGKELVKQYSFTEGEITIKKTPSTVDIPWTVVFANQSFGTLVSDKSLGFTWALNSGENKLTLRSGDTMTDNIGEFLFLKYKDSFYDLVSLGRAKFSSSKAEWETVVEKIKFKISVCVADRGMCKKCEVEMLNNRSNADEFELIYYTVPILGKDKNGGTFFAKEIENGVLLQNSFSAFKGYSALTCGEKADWHCFSPSAFSSEKTTDAFNKIGKNPCAAIGKKISLASGKKCKTTFYLSWAASEKAAEKMPEVSKFEKSTVQVPGIESGNALINLFCNSFLYSQIKQSRFFGRTGFYQCSGTYGFRDQLQDSLAFIKSEPELTKRHIIRCASVQFEQGDVLHWWHVILNGGQMICGIRSRCSDDLLWLVYVCCVYAEETGDFEIFKVNAPYIIGEELKDGERERYLLAERTDYAQPILTHCIKAVDRSLNFGKNGLPLIGSCDWNDGFSKIGEVNRAESVWLGMFLKIVLEKTAEVCEKFEKTEKALEYRQTAKILKKSIEEKAWQGDRYARIIFENGEFFEEKEDFIDILPQAFAVFAKIGDEKRAETALLTAYERLFDEKSGVIRLLSPGFDASKTETVGYIAAYPSGIRENAGQYTHAAVWLAAAMLEKGMVKQGRKLLKAINPLSFYSSKEKAAVYRAEPYVLAGDVSFGKGIIGRAGWTHFTGSAAWYYRTVLRYADLLKDEL